MMKSKNWIKLVSIIIALILPLGAMAQGAAYDVLSQAKEDGKEIVSTVTFEPGAMLAADQMVADMCDVTSLVFRGLSDGYGSMAVLLNGEEMVSAKIRVDEDGLYAQSEVLGDDTLYLSWADMETALTDSLKSSGMDEEEISAMMESFSTGMEQMAAVGTIAESGNIENMSKEELKQKMLEAMGGDESLMEWVSGIEAKMVVTNGSFTLEDSDVADTKTELTITKEDIIALYETQYMKDMLKRSLQTGDSTLSDDDAAAQVDEVIAEMKTALEKSEFSIPVVEYTIGEDELVAMQMNMAGVFYEDTFSSEMTGSDETADATTETVTQEPTKMDMNMKIIRKTVADAKVYTLTMDMTVDDDSSMALNGDLSLSDTAVAGNLYMIQDGNPMVTISFVEDKADPADVTGKLSLTAMEDDTSYAIELAFTQKVTENTIDTSIGLSYADTIDAIAANPDVALLGTLKVNTVVQDDSGYFTSVAGATPETSVQIMQMSDSDLETYVSSLETSAMTVVYNMMANLPESVLQAMSESAN